MRLDHEIFQGPLSVEIPLEHEHDRQDDYPGPVWEVHTGVFPDGVDVGVVSDGHGFEDSPDCERISGGINSKGPHAVAIGRQGNMLQWGFYGAPDRMTESGKRVFLNALVYMTKFDGHRPLVEKEANSRTWILRYIDGLAAMPEEKRSSDDGTAKWLREQLERVVPAEIVPNPEAMRAWYREHEELLYCDERYAFSLDEDLSQLGLSNRKADFLVAMRARLEKEPQDELAWKLVRRYVGEGFADAAAFAAWVEENRDFLFFTDTGGYRWMVDENARRAASKGSGG